MEANTAQTMSCEELFSGAGNGRRWWSGRRLAPAAAGFMPALCLWAVSAAAQTNGISASAQAKGTAVPVEQTIQLATPPASANAGPPLTLTLADALTRARQNSPQFQAAVTAAKQARENHMQARAAMLPSLSDRTEYLNTQGNGISPVGRFVTNDGVHVYRQWAVVRQDMPGSFFIDGGLRETAYLAAVANAQQEMAQRGLSAAITQDYYALVVAQRDYAVAEQSLTNSRRFLGISEALEQGGEVAHADVIRFQLQVNQDERGLEDADLTMSQARSNLAVLLFPGFNEDFTVVDDLDTPPPLPDFPQMESMASKQNPDLAAALASYHAAGEQVAVARSAFFPSLSVEFDYGIEANAFALHSRNTTKLDVIQPNLGYFVTYSLTMPVWDWGANLSRLRQAEHSKGLAQVDLSFTQRQVVSRLYSYYNEAATAWNQLGNLGRSVELAQQNLQLVTMQYQAGETAVLNVLDAETSLAGARVSDAAGEQRYRNALATLQTVTGNF